MKLYLVDTFAMVVFSTLVGAFVEIVLAGLQPIQSFSIRLAAVPLILIIGRPYGLYRDKLFALFGDKPATQLRSLMIDSLANVTFQVPVYLALLSWGGASLQQMAIAATSIVIIAATSGRPYGVFLGLCRKLFRA
jgi:hypothetical protein